MSSHKTGQDFSWRTSREMWALFVLALITLIVLSVSSHARRPFASAEVKFADSSAHGLSIVPASCPSDPPYSYPDWPTRHPHYPEQCDGVPPPVGAGACVIYADPMVALPQQDVTLLWNTGSSGPWSSAPYDMSISPDVGSVGPQGSSIVHPLQTTTYTFSGTWKQMWGGVTWWSQPFSCSRTVVVNACPAGYTLQNGVCVLTSCPAGYTLQNGSCVLTSCPAGYTLQNGECVNQCGALAFCQGNDLYVRNATTCQATLYASCAYGCLNGMCRGTPSPLIVTWDVHPVLVQKNSTVSVQWEAQNVSSCVVTGTNGDGTGNNATGAWTTKSGSKTSSPIIAQTIYTITCQALPGGSPSSVTRSTTVNIIPIFNEP